MACKHKKRLWENGWCNVACRYCTFTQENSCEHNEQTNADRIRAMSDEELARVFRGTGCPLVRSDQDCGQFANCGNCWLDWFKQPVKDGEDDG